MSICGKPAEIVTTLVMATPGANHKDSIASALAKILKYPMSARTVRIMKMLILYADQGDALGA
jgi:hypothetical protein